MLLYLVKHSRPDIANAVRELSKAMDGASVQAWKELQRVLKYVIDTKEWGLLMKPHMSKEWRLVAYSDADWAGDTTTRKSVSGHIIYFMGAPIVWRSKAQTTVSLSSTEAEYNALTETAREIKFVVQLLSSIGYEVERPVVVHVDNMAAIQIAESDVSSGRTKHFDIKQHYIRECIVDGSLKIMFVRSEGNRADIFTKNTPENIHSSHNEHLVGISSTQHTLSSK